MFLPHRDNAEVAKAHAWFAGVPAGGAGFSIGSSATYLEESKDGPYGRSSSKLFITPDGSVGFGTTEPVGHMDIQVPADSKKAEQAVNIRGGSINLDFGRGLHTG